MLIPTVIMAALAAGLLIAGYAKGGNRHVEGMRQAVQMSVHILPLLFCAFIVAGMVQVLLPEGLVARWVGGRSGLRGVLLGSVAGALTPGGPYVSLPIAGGLMRAGAGTATMVAFLTGWSLWALNRLPMEVGILGWRFALVRLASTIVLPPVAGVIAYLLFERGG